MNKYIQDSTINFLWIFCDLIKFHNDLVIIHNLYWLYVILILKNIQFIQNIYIYRTF